MKESPLKFFLLTIFFLNLLIISTFFILRWMPYFSDKKEICVIAIYLIALCLLSIIGLASSATRSAAILWNVSQFGFILVLSFFEIVFFLFPGLIPQSLLQQNPALLNRQKQIPKMVEYLEKNPWVKFSAESTIRTVGYRGDDFTYEWKTDKFGFKNISEVANATQVKAVALGDSFVEGMGVAVEDAWPTLVSRNGFMIYNLGVQGYAPIQTVGALEHWGRNFKPEYVIFGYTPGFEIRELNYLDEKEVVKQKTFTGGIDSVSNYMGEKRRTMKTNRHFEVTNAVVDLIKSSVKGFVRTWKIQNAGSRSNSVFLPYLSEVQDGREAVFSEDSREFQLTRIAILKVKKVADDMQAKMVVVYFPHRFLIYYKPILGSNAPQSHYERRTAESIKKLCFENKIDFVDLSGRIQNYVDGLANQSRIKATELPYFKMDGHLNRIGHHLVADAIVKYFEENQS